LTLKMSAGSIGVMRKNKERMATAGGPSFFSYSKRHSFLWAAQLSASFDTDIAIVIDSRIRLSITTAYILIYVR
jgi:hypothetical protein